MERNETRNWKIYNANIYVVLLFEEPLASFVRSKRDGPSHANTYGSFLYIFVQNGFGTISEERSGEIARNRKQSCVRVAQVPSRDPMHLPSYSVVGTLFSRGTWATQSFLLVNGALFFELHVASTRWSRSKQLSVEAICVSVSEFIVPEYRSAKSTRKCERMSDDEILRKRAKDGLILLLRYTFATLMYWQFFGIQIRATFVDSL